MKPGPRSFGLCMYFNRVVSNQTAFPSTVHSQREREKGREIERQREREKLLLILIWPCIVFMGPFYIREEEESPFVGRMT